MKDVCNNRIRHDYRAQDAIDDLNLAIAKASDENSRIRESRYSGEERLAANRRW